MNHRGRVLIVAAMLACVPVAVVPMQGCANTGNAVTDNRINYREALELSTTLNNSWAAILEADARKPVAQRRVDDATRARARTAFQTSDRLLDQWKAAVLADQPFDGWQSVRTVLSELVQITAAFE